MFHIPAVMPMHTVQLINFHHLSFCSSDNSGFMLTSLHVSFCCVQYNTSRNGWINQIFFTVWFLNNSHNSRYRLFSITLLIYPFSIVCGIPKLGLDSVLNKNLAIANRSHGSCVHNTFCAFIGLNITQWPWNLG